MAPDHLERLAACLIEHRGEWGYSRSLDVSIGGHIRPQVFNLHDPVTRRLWRERHCGYLPSTSVRHTRSCLSDYGFWCEQLAFPISGVLEAAAAFRHRLAARPARSTYTP